MSSSDARSLSLLSAIVQWSADAIVSSDLNHIVTSWNPAAERLFGYSAAEAIGQSFEITVPPDLVVRRRRQMTSLLPGEAAQGIETFRLRKDGSRVEVEITTSVLQDADGTVIGWSSILRDISERKAAEARLRELEHRYRTFVEQMPALTYIRAPGSGWKNLPLLHLSARVEDLVGYTAQEWIDNPRFKFTIMHPDDRDQVVELDNLSANTGQPFHAEYRVFLPDGRVRWFRDDAILVNDDDGQPLYWLGFLLDITDHKRAEDELRTALVGLRAANTELERVSKVKSEFLSMISHEFRTPLTSIQGYSELISDEDLSEEEIRTFSTTINVNARRLARMIRDLLDLDRLESGRILVQREHVDLNEIADGVLESLGPAAAHHHVVTDFDIHLPLIRGDSDLLTQVATNLVGNALKYSPKGGEIAVSTACAGDLVRLSVRDHGLGIPTDQLETIFARYERVSRPEQDQVEGSGLGLPIARQIVELHRGRIWAELPEDGGSLFTVELPIDASPASA